MQHHLQKVIQFEITVSATGYLPQSFTYTTKVAPAPAEVNTATLEATIAKAEGLKEADYTADSWKAMQVELATAKAALEAKESQDAVDAAAASLQASIDALKAATPAESEDVDTAALEKVIATAKGLNKNDYTATTWTTMQAALTNAEKALEAKESQTSVDEAAKTLQAAIDGLKKASATRQQPTTRRITTAATRTIITAIRITIRTIQQIVLQIRTAQLVQRQAILSA